MTLDRTDLFIDGGFVGAHSHKRVTLISPTSESVIGRVPDGDAVDVDRAVRAARAAFPAWRETTPQERAAYLRALADAYQRRKEEISGLIILQNASPHWWTVQENENATIASYRASADVAARLEPETVVESEGGRTLLCRAPLGVAAAIVPWNAPQILLASKIGAALGAGCTVVAKPSPETSLDAYILAEIVQEIDLPPGVVNIVTGDRETGAALVAHPDVDKVAFTGSTAAGRSIAATCGEALRPVTAELGGKSAAVILDDADLDVFGRAMLQWCVPFSSQVCYSATRILAPKSRFDEVLDAVVATLQSLAFGDPADPSIELGPLVSERQRTRVEGFLSAGQRDGARAILGGGRPREFPSGYYIEPTVFVDVEPEMAIFREEIFGPVLCVVPYTDEDEAVALHNATDYGLAGAVFSAGPDHAIAFSRRLETGAVHVNGADGAAGVSPAALKNSGIGLGGSREIDEYQYVRAIALGG